MFGSFFSVLAARNRVKRGNLSKTHPLGHLTRWPGHDLSHERHPVAGKHVLWHHKSTVPLQVNNTVYSG